MDHVKTYSSIRVIVFKVILGSITGLIPKWSVTQKNGRLHGETGHFGSFSALGTEWLAVEQS